MNHDIAHCKGDGCKLKELCVRYRAHVDAEEKKLDYLWYVKPQRAGNDCESFWRFSKDA